MPQTAQPHPAPTADSNFAAARQFVAHGRRRQLDDRGALRGVHWGGWVGGWVPLEGGSHG